MKIKEVVEQLLAYHPTFPPEYNGCDCYKSGDPEAECTGVVVALVPTINVIRKAIELGANLIIAHEPTYHTSKDEAGWFESFDNCVAKEKEAMLKEHGIAIWRDHDHMHAHQPDQIFTGVVENLGWYNKDYYVNDKTGFYYHHIVTIEETTLLGLCEYLKKALNLNGVKYIGDPDMKVKKVAFIGHLFPENPDAQYSVNCIKELEDGADVVLPLETIDWTIGSYVRDGYQLGKKKGMICIGHFNIEELGMKYLSEKIETMVDDSIKVTYVPSEDMYQYYI